MNRLLIDGDILRYEVGFAGQPYDDTEGKTVPMAFETVKEILENKISLILEDTNPDAEVVVYLTADRALAKAAGIEYKPNFRDAVAVTKPYKGTRKNDKPFHYNNLTALLHNSYDCVVSSGIEADDQMGRDQFSSPEGTTIICSRDKDLRQVPGWHYSWECGRQASVGPHFTDKFGSLFYTGPLEGKKPKLLGYGDLFFYYQMLAGDTVDNIPGCPGIGEVNAYRLLSEATSCDEAEAIVRKAYAERKGADYEIYYREQEQLLRIDYDGQITG
jgi:hypothetical protein